MTTKSIQLFTIILLCLILALGSCHKSVHKDVVDMDTDSGVIKHFNFLPGTYWIYNDLVSGRLDSFYVRSNDYQLQGETYNIYKYHIITLAEVNIDGKNPADSSNWTFNYQGTRIMLDYEYATNPYGWKYLINYAPMYMYPFHLGDMMGRNDSSNVIQIDSVYAVNGQFFYNVAQVYHHCDPDSTTSGINITKLDDWFFMNDSVGMVTMVIKHPHHGVDHLWQLLRYKIVR